MPYDQEGYECEIVTLTDTTEKIFQVGKENVKIILEHCALGEGDKWFYDVIYSNGTVYRCFNPQGVKMTRI